MTAHDLKHLQTRLAQVEAEVKDLRARKTEIDRELQAKGDTVAGIRREIKAIEERSADVIVTEHAMLRYIERVYGINLEELKAQMVPKELQDRIHELGTGEYGWTNCNGTYRIKTKGATVITVLKDGV